ncbi:hypothetical protein [Nocardia sp. NPDC057455]|uniref:hypothetical protein n=1 Tax=Nocardia sp. NPDC057455 TaxID=3346138 RepID=UPI00366FCA93
MRVHLSRLVLVFFIAAWTFAAGAAAHATPPPGSSFDYKKFTAEMAACDADGSTMSDNHILYGAVHPNGSKMQLRCYALRHMIDGGHDPFLNPQAFLDCVDRLVSYGFPRDGNKPGHKVNILQYRGTSSRAKLAYDTNRGNDILTVYTEPRDNEWFACATM